MMNPISSLFQDSVNKVLQNKICDSFDGKVSFVIYDNILNIDVNYNIDSMLRISRNLFKLTENRSHFFYTQINIKFRGKTLKLTTLNTANDIAKYQEMVELVLGNDEVSSISTLDGYGMIQSNNMLDNENRQKNISRIYNTKNLHDHMFYKDKSVYNKRNDLLIRHNILTDFEYDAYLSKDVLNDNNTNTNTKIIHHRIAQTSKLVEFFNKPAIISTFQFN